MLYMVHDKKELLPFLSQNPELFIYLYGDLDDFFWPKTIWYALKSGDQIEALALLYVGMKTPTFLLFQEGDPEPALKLLEEIQSFLPNQFYSHLSEPLQSFFNKDFRIHHPALHTKMALAQKAKPVSDINIRFLTEEDLSAIYSLYQESYPGNWFDPRMLETGKYLGYWQEDKLAGIAGIHVYSEEYQAAALGNITTHPDHRGKGIARKLTQELCFELQKTVRYIGLNVKADNAAAIKVYERIGFEKIGFYVESLMEREG